MAAKIKPYICAPNNVKLYTYWIYQDNRIVEKNILGWRTALAHARKWKANLFDYVNKVEILNLFTGEVLTLEEAEKKANAYKARKPQGAVISATT